MRDAALKRAAQLVAVASQAVEVEDSALLLVARVQNLRLGRLKVSLQLHNLVAQIGEFAGCLRKVSLVLFLLR